MNIFFAGIGGVGVGPLAQIAYDAGYTVQGSDKVASPMTEALQQRGVPVAITETTDYLQASHSAHPIDWFVYTSALPQNHSELQLARELGIKTAKRDELIAHIIKEKKLRLIAIAGTHGKTTTTGMAIWTMQQLGIPISYSVGATLGFGPSGKYTPGSRYFVYECDEFDRNFLHFSPYVSLITSLDYDHPDTFPTKADYQTAFSQFIHQSSHTIMWKTDSGVLAVPQNSWLLHDNEVLPLPLAGVHNRRNATLVVKAMEYIQAGTPHDVIDHISHFPGTDRRFERLADNLYSDYGHHPVEIAATLQMAHELSNDIVLVYQPHQNIRQHEIKEAYTRCFELADTVYWLPTYLSRENPDLPILSPQELIENVTNRSAIVISDLNDTLWQAIEQARSEGKLVLCMGAGTIDQWVRRHLLV